MMRGVMCRSSGLCEGFHFVVLRVGWGGGGEFRIPGHLALSLFPFSFSFSVLSTFSILFFSMSYYTSVLLHLVRKVDATGHRGSWVEDLPWLFLSRCTLFSGFSSLSNFLRYIFSRNLGSSASRGKYARVYNLFLLDFVVVRC